MLIHANSLCQILTAWTYWSLMRSRNSSAVCTASSITWWNAFTINTAQEPCHAAVAVPCTFQANTSSLYISALASKARNRDELYFHKWMSKTPAIQLHSQWVLYGLTDFKFHFQSKIHQNKPQMGKSRKTKTQHFFNYNRLPKNSNI